LLLYQGTQWIFAVLLNFEFDFDASFDFSSVRWRLVLSPSPSPSHYPRLLRRAPIMRRCRA
jgi:hypothetical protein